MNSGTNLTYPEVGLTRDNQLPEGYRHVRRDAVISRDDEAAFRRVRDGMRDWRIHRLAGLRVRAEAIPAVGVAFSAGLGVLNWRLWVPCRVVWLRDEAGVYGYGFGTVPGHPERGEEAFEVVQGNDGTVKFSIRAFSRPAAWYARLGGPLATLLQDHVTDRYVDSARRLARQPTLEDRS